MRGRRGATLTRMLCCISRQNLIHLERGGTPEEFNLPSKGMVLRGGFARRRQLSQDVTALGVFVKQDKDRDAHEGDEGRGPVEAHN